MSMESQLPNVALAAAAQYLLAARDVLDIARAVANGGAARRVDAVAGPAARLRRHAAGRLDDRRPAVLMIGVVVADALTIGGQPVVQPHSSLGASPYW